MARSVTSHSNTKKVYCDCTGDDAGPGTTWCATDPGTSGGQYEFGTCKEDSIGFNQVLDRVLNQALNRSESGSGSGLDRRDLDGSSR